MAKDAAEEEILGRLHKELAMVFTEILCKEKERMNSNSKVPYKPDSVMLGTIAKFLKDNGIMYASQEVSRIATMQERLSRRKEHRQDCSVTDIRTLKVLDDV